MSPAGKLTLIVGCGFTGLELAQRLTFKGLPVAGTTRSIQNATVIRSRGASVIVMDAADPSPLKDVLGRLHAVVYMVPPQEGDGGSTIDHTSKMLELARDSGVERFIYVSSTSVYGDHGGGVVDEHSPCQPDSPRGTIRRAIELEVLGSGLPAVVVRPAGIYGPGRSMLHRLATGRYRLVDGGHAVTNRIHVADLATLLERCLTKSEPGSIYLGCDAQPTTQRELVSMLTREFGTPAPQEMSLEEAEIRMSPDVLKMVTGSKRLDSSWTRAALGFELKYPDFLAGCRQIWMQEGAELRRKWSAAEG